MSYPSYPGPQEPGQSGYPAPQDSGQPGYSPQPGYSSQPQPGYSPQQYSPQGYPQPGYSAEPPKASSTGAKVLTFLGVASLVLGIAGVVAGVVFMVQPVAAVVDGSGSGVVSRIGSGETVTVDLGADKTYAVWIVSDSDSGAYSGDPVVTSPGGRDIDVRSSSSTTGRSGGTSATSGWVFTTDEAGDYEITAPWLSSGDLVLTSEDLVVKIGIGIALLVVGIGLGGLGLVLTIVGIIWWVSRRKKARALPGPSYA